jgi:hypothetical protein
MTGFIAGETFHVSGSIYEKLEITADAIDFRQIAFQILNRINHSIQKFCAWRRKITGIYLQVG